jgi:hypothetical protein
MIGPYLVQSKPIIQPAGCIPLEAQDGVRPHSFGFDQIDMA